MRPDPQSVLVTGATGYMGSRLVPMLARRGHLVTAIVRQSSIDRAPAGCECAVADVLDGSTWRRYVTPEHTLVHLVGTPHPSPAKAQEFVAVDLKSIEEAVKVATEARVRHLVYLSVAQPAPAMQAYIDVRAKGEDLIRAAGLNATILRPWYVLGPGHRWPLALAPLYKVAEWVPATREGARRLGLVTISQMLAALVGAVENPTEGIRIVGVPEIRSALE